MLTILELVVKLFTSSTFIDFILVFFRKWCTGTDFLKERKRLRASQVWLLEIFEENPEVSFDTFEIFDEWEPIASERMKSVNFSVDGVFSRLQELHRREFITKTKEKGKIRWQLSPDYKKKYIPREEDWTH